MIASRCPHPVEWFYLIGGLFLATSYFWFLDDAFVYFRYVDNLLFLGHGLVYNQGEYVEGFSSPLWILLLSVIRATGVTYLAAVRFVMVASFALSCFILVEVNRRLSPETQVVNVPLAYPAFNYGVLCAFSGLPEHVYEKFWPQRYARFMPLAGGALALFVLSFYPPQLDRHPLFFYPEHREVNKIYDAWFQRRSPFLHYLRWGKEVNIEKLQKYRESNPQLRYTDIGTGASCLENYERFDKRIIHLLGLTDAILARTVARAWRPGHKYKLMRLAKDLVRIHESSEKVGRDMYRKTVEDDYAPGWVVKNLETIEVIERKIYNEHNLSGNVKLAFTFPEKIMP